MTIALPSVMAGLVPAIHAFDPPPALQGVDARDEPGHDVGRRDQNAAERIAGEISTTSQYFQTSCAGLTRASIIRRGWIAGSSPAMTGENSA
ncbi:hypothetical protein [Rhodopseudomonas palustris]|uniref:Uncharacterized protein n=1 Tax=Rhodopseudomonas palustris TaxID=1076 RepID=A0A418V3Y1_RHOPL|nr:hypothetical protein [Rhodopseudomonas palustris]RJF70801.1 hypothetical protein D4Q52_15910 [Rhodopseudomonas palustris]